MTGRPNPSFREELLAHVPGLRGFAMSLCGQRERADDLVQDTLMRAWASHASFAAGTNMRAWLFTILRNAYFGELRKRRREVEDADGVYAATLATPGEQEGHLDFTDFLSALTQLSDDQREALILVGASGFSYEEAARITGVPIGTVKSRLNRAREKLAKLLKLDSVAPSDEGGAGTERRPTAARM